MYFESKYPEIAQNCRCIFDDSDMRYAAIREGRYADVVKDIKCGYYFFIAADEYDFKTGVYTKEEFEKRQERSAENFKREIEVCNLMENGDSAEVEKFLQENIDRNTKLLKTQLKLDVKDFTKTV